MEEVKRRIAECLDYIDRTYGGTDGTAWFVNYDNSGIVKGNYAQQIGLNADEWACEVLRDEPEA
jgi:hypothetical protein